MWEDRFLRNGCPQKACLRVIAQPVPDTCGSSAQLTSWRVDGGGVCCAREQAINVGVDVVGWCGAVIVKEGCMDGDDPVSWNEF